MRNSELLVWYGMVLTLLAVLVDVFVPVSTTEAQSSTGERPISVLCTPLFFTNCTILLIYGTIM
jgi:hypothetical protein